MPVERHAERLATPLSRRDKRFLLASGIVAAFAILAGVLYVAFHDGSRAGEKCFTATFAASLGGATVHYCGAAAAHYCRVNAAGAPRVAEAAAERASQSARLPSPVSLRHEGDSPRRQGARARPTARPASTLRARSGRSSPSRRCSCARTASVQDVRLPLADGQPIQFLTTRDKRRPRRALRAAPLDRPSARRGGAPALPGREGRDRPADRERLLLRLRVPRADQRGRPRADRGRGQARARRGARAGPARRSPRRGARALRGRGRAVQGRARRHRRGRRSRCTRSRTGDEFTDLCRGPHLQDSAPDQGVQADRASPAPTGAATSTTRS